MTGVELAQGLARGVHIAGAMSVFGTVVFCAVVLPPGLTRAPDEPMRSMDRRIARLLPAGVAVSIVAACIWLLLQAVDLADAGVEQVLATIPIVLLETHSGTILILRLVFIVLAAIMYGRGRDSRIVMVAACFAACGVALQAGLGHGASMEGATGWTLIIVEALHLLAASAWLGGLVPLLISVGTMPSDAARAVVLRFSKLGIVCVAILAGTILVQGWILIGGLPGLVGTDYGLLALSKLVLFVALLGIAALNRFRYTPSLTDSSMPEARTRLQRSIAGEALVGLGVILMAGLLLMQPPAIHQQPIWLFPYQFSLVTQEDPDLRNETLFGATLAIGAFAFVCLAVAWRRGRLLAVAAAVALAWWSWPHLSLLLIPAYPTSFYHSPTGFTAAAVARGSELFAQNCTVCHGEEGRGNGPLAKNLPIPPADLTAPHLFEHSDGEMFWWLSYGIEVPSGSLAMPGFSNRLEEDDLWNLIDYVRAHNAGLAMAETGRLPHPILAPDIPVSLDTRSVALSSVHDRFFLVVAGEAAPPSLPPEGDLTITPVRLMPGTDGWIAYAVAAGVKPDELAGTMFLIDKGRWLRGVFRSKDTQAWPDPAVIVAAARDAAAHPIEPSGGSHQHQH